MKRTIMSLSAIIALSSFLSAGTYGNQYNTYDGVDTEIGMVVDVPEIIYEKEGQDVSSMWSSDGSGFYLSGAYAYTGITEDIVIDDGSERFTGGIDETGNGWMFAVGYDFNHYFGVEARYSGVSGVSKEVTLIGDNGSTITNTGDMDIANLALYLKGSYPITEQFSIYGLLGYGLTSWIVEENSSYTAWYSESGFQYGGGLKYSFSENFSIFADYTLLYDDGINPLSTLSIDSSIYTANIGISYKF